MGMDMDMAGFSSSNARHQFRMPPMFLHPSASLLKSPQVQELKKKKKKKKMSSGYRVKIIENGILRCTHTLIWAILCPRIYIEYMEYIYIYVFI